MLEKDLAKKKDPLKKFKCLRYKGKSFQKICEVGKKQWFLTNRVQIIKSQKKNKKMIWLTVLAWDPYYPTWFWQAVDLMNKYITKYANFLNVKIFKYQMLFGHKNMLISYNPSTRLIKGETLRIKSTY